MEIKVGIRVKVLVSPLPSRVYCSPENPFFPSLPESLPPSRPALYLYSFSLTLVSTLVRWRPKHSRRRSPRPPPSPLPFLLPPQLLFRPFSRPGSNLRPGCPSSECYFCNVLTDNRFSFCFHRLSGFAAVEETRYIYIYTVFFLLFFLPSSLCFIVRLRDLKNVDGGPVAG